MTRSTITETHHRHRAEFILRTPFGVLLAADRAALIKATARDAGVTVKAVLEAFDAPPRTGRVAATMPGALT